MTLTAGRGSLADLADRHDPLPVLSHDQVWSGLIFGVARDRVDLGDRVVTRDYLTHPGAVVIVPLHQFDGIDHVLLINQYRHAVGGYLWELPAGLLDVPGEPPAGAAARELAEEVDLRAGTWHVLADDVASPGILPEWVRILLARDLVDIPVSDRHQRTGEEALLTALWVPLDDAVTAALTGRIHNAATIIGLLATEAHRRRDWRDLRAADAPWPEHPAYRDQA